MDFEELVSRYKMIALWQRILVVVVLACIPAVLNYTDEIEVLEAEKETINNELASVRSAYEKEVEKRQKIPELEAKLNFTEQQLKEAAKNLPEHFKIDEVLQSVSIIARTVGVEISSFDPGVPKIGNAEYKYMEMPVYLKVSAPFHQTASFIDKVLHSRTMIHIKDVKFIPHQKEEQIEDEKISEVEVQKRARSNRSLTSTFALTIYKSMTPEEEVLYAPPPPPPEPVEGEKKGEGETTNEAPAESNKENPAPAAGNQAKVEIQQSGSKKIKM